jgi:hypothetical protein
LTCDFWAENAKKNTKDKKKIPKTKSKSKNNDNSVVSPLGLHSGLRQGGRPLRGQARRWAEAQLYLEATASARWRDPAEVTTQKSKKARARSQEQRQKAKAKAKAGILRFAQNDTH